MKLVIVVLCWLLVLALSACTRIVPDTVWSAAQEVCFTNGGVRWVDAELLAGDRTGSVEAKCKNGATFELRVNYRTGEVMR